MPQWDNQPPASTTEQIMRIYRVPGRPPVVMTITSRQLIGCPIHWYKGRTLPCENNGCPACHEGLAWRWKGYIGALLAGTNEHVMLELTATTAQQLAECRQEKGTLRGLLCKATRVPERDNGRLIIQTKWPDTTPASMPEPPNVHKIMARIWQIPEHRVDTTLHTRLINDQQHLTPTNGHHGPA